MSLKNFLRTEIGERIEHSDFRFAMEISPRRMLQSIMNDLILGDNGGSLQAANYVISGFAMNAVGTVVSLEDGVAVVGLREGGSAEFGMLLSAGATSRNQDINGFADGTYGVYVRAEFHDSDFLNRLFWNPIAPSPVETPRNIAVRKTEDWSMTVELVSPGPEWIQIATAAKTGGSVVMTDTRPWLFDTSDGNIADAIWGSANDRSTNTSAFGIKGLRRGFMAAAKQIMNIVGGTNWKASPQAGNANGAGARSLTQLNAEKLALNGSMAMTGDLDPNANETLDLGSPGTRWRDGHFANVDASDTVAGQSAQFSANAVADGFIGASFVQVLADAPNPIVSSQNQLFGDTMPRAWARIDTTTAPSVTLTREVGIASVQFQNAPSRVEVTMDIAFDGPTDYVVVVTNGGVTDRFWTVNYVSDTVFELLCFSLASGAQLDLDNVNATACLTIFGRR